MKKPRFEKTNPGYISQLRDHKRSTFDKDLALYLSECFGEKPIEYINEKAKKAYLIAYPELGKPVRGNGRK